MAIDAEAISLLRRDGFLVVEDLLSKEEAHAARAGAFAQVAPPFARRHEPAAGHGFFPWLDDGLNQVALHPSIIAAAERVLGTREVLLLTGFVMVKHAGVEYGSGFHIDYANNTLGPALERDDFQHLSFFLYLDDVDAGLAPILMVPNGRSDAEARPITGRAGTACIYSIYTRHSASPFARDGHRVSMWVNVARKDRPWDAALRFDAHAARNQQAMQRVIAAARPRQREFIGFPPPGDPLWTPSFLAGMSDRYPGFDPRPYAAADPEPAAAVPTAFSSSP